MKLIAEAKRQMTASAGRWPECNVTSVCPKWIRFPSCSRQRLKDHCRLPVVPTTRTSISSISLVVSRQVIPVKSPAFKTRRKLWNSGWKLRDESQSKHVSWKKQQQQPKQLRLLDPTLSTSSWSGSEVSRGADCHFRLVFFGRKGGRWSSRSELVPTSDPWIQSLSVRVWV